MVVQEGAGRMTQMLVLHIKNSLFHHTPPATVMETIKYECD